MANRVPTFRPRTLPGPDRHKLYDKFGRNPEAERFYQSRAWRSVRLSKLRESPLCECCLKLQLLVPATIVHHKVSVLDDVDSRLDMGNLESLCASCHSRLHASGTVEQA